jgi:hypothetical protein
MGMGLQGWSERLPGFGPGFGVRGGTMSGKCLNGYEHTQGRHSLFQGEGLLGL